MTIKTIFLLTLTGITGFLALFSFLPPSFQAPPKTTRELFDASLAEHYPGPAFYTYTDSVIKSTCDRTDSLCQANTWAHLLRKRFLHEYSHYDIRSNWIAFLAGKFIREDLSAIVIPDDILKHPNAACSQQAIVLMSFLQRRGYAVRPVLFRNHFAAEVFYDGAWHFYDTDLEPNEELLNEHKRPSVRELRDNPELLADVYQGKLSPEELAFTFGEVRYGAANRFPAKNARIFHYVTKFTSYILWIFPLILLLRSRRAARRLTSHRRSPSSLSQKEF